MILYKKHNKQTDYLTKQANKKASKGASEQEIKRLTK